jgi:hypothetical protein
MSSPIKKDDIFDSRVRVFISGKLAEQTEKYKFAKLDANINYNYDVFDVRARIYMVQKDNKK